MGKAGRFRSDALEDIVDERVHNTHGFAGDSSVRVNLFQDLVDVDRIAFLSLSSLLLLARAIDRARLSLACSLLALFCGRYFWCHECLVVDKSLRFSKSASITQVYASSIYPSKFNGSINMRIEIAAFSPDWLLLKSETPIKSTKAGRVILHIF